MHIKNIDVLYMIKSICLSFIQECIENKDLNGIAAYVADNQKKFRDEEKKFWTGIDVLDKTIYYEKKEKWMLWI